MKVTIEVQVSASIQDVWQAWTTPEDIMQWNAASAEWTCPHAELDLRPGGGFLYRMEAKDGSMGFDFVGTFASVSPGEAIELVLEDERSVLVEFLAAGDIVIVRESFDAEPGQAAEQQRHGWQAILDNFARHVEGKAS